jgi:hypothetical protein
MMKSIRPRPSISFKRIICCPACTGFSGPEALWKRISDLFDPSIGRSIRPIRRWREPYLSGRMPTYPFRLRLTHRSDTDIARPPPEFTRPISLCRPGQSIERSLVTFLAHFPGTLLEADLNPESSNQVKSYVQHGMASDTLGTITAT